MSGVRGQKRNKGRARKMVYLSGRVIEQRGRVERRHEGRPVCLWRETQDGIL